MNIKYLMTLLPLCGALLCAAQDDGSRLKFNPERPKAGQPVELTYKPLPSMTGRQSIDGVAYTFKNQRWEASDITLNNVGNVWKGSFTPADERGFMAFKFVVDTIVDSGDGVMPFAMMINNDEGKAWPEGFAAWGLLRSDRYGHAIPGYMDFTKEPEVSDTVVYYWMNNEIAYNHSSAVAYAPLLVKSATAAKMDNAGERAAKAVKFLLNEGSEQALMNARDIVVENAPLYDSISAVIIERYPQGNLALWRKMTEKYDYRNNDSIRRHCEEFIAQFPMTDERQAFLMPKGKSYDDVLMATMFLDYMEGKDLLNDKRIDDLTLAGLASMFYRLVDIPHMRKDKTSEELRPFADRIVSLMNASKANRPEWKSYLSPKEWHNEVDQMIISVVAEPYSEVLKETGDYKKALEYALLAQRRFNYGRAEVNDNMAQILKTLDKTDELKSLLAKSVYNNQVSDLQTDMLKELYIADNGSDNGFDAYMVSLRNPGEQSRIQQEIKEYEVDGKMPQWQLTDADGKTVSSDMLKGKVYVIDFWANWCHPCKAALPGMQMAVTHFKDDPDVEFLFIDTQEYAPGYREKAANYLKEKGLNLHLVYDGKGEADLYDELCANVMKQYHTSGIPLKIVVDADGNVRYLSSGYKGSPSGLRDEMIEMVNQARKKL